MMAATYGPSADIISHVAARGSQKTRIVRMLNTRRRSYRTRIPRVSRLDAQKPMEVAFALGRARRPRVSQR
jgi:hypothetical protein